MPDRRLVFPSDVTGVEEPGALPADGSPHEGSSFVLVIPSVGHVVQAAWLAALRRGELEPFAGWLSERLHEEQADWRYDTVVRDLVSAVGADRVMLVAGRDRKQVEAALADLGDRTPTALRPWPGLLGHDQVALLDSLLADLGQHGPTGLNAAELVHGAATSLAASGREVDGPALPGELAARLAELAAAMRAATERLGVGVRGDRDALLWTAGSRTGATGTVPLTDAVTSAVGVVDRIAEWGGRP